MDHTRSADGRERQGRPEALLMRSVRAACDRPVRTTAVVGVLVAAAQIWWIAQHRGQGGFDGDETGYLATALRFHTHLADGGVGSLAEAALNNPRIGPLVPLLSVPFVAMGGRSVVWVMLVQPLFHLATAVAVAAVVTRCSGRRAALTAGIVSLGLPVSLISARSYHLALPAAMFLVFAVLALLSSERGHRTLPMVLLGASAGAMMITRTASISFLPALPVAAMIEVRWNWRVLRNVAATGLAFLAVAAPWWIVSWQSISDYLLKFGYGPGAAELGPSSPLLRLLVRLGVVIVEVRPLLLLPAVLVLVSAAGRRWSGPSTRSLGPPEPDAARRLLVLWSVVVLGFVGLLTSANIGTYLQSPLVMLAVAAVCASAGRVDGRAVRAAGAIAVVASVANVVFLSHWRVGSGIALPETSASIVLFGGVETAQAINFAAGDPRFAPSAAPEERATAEREWAAAANEVAQELEVLRHVDRPMMRTFVGDVRLLEAGTLEFATRLTGRGVSDWEAPTARSTIGDGVVDLDPWAGAHRRVLVSVETLRRDVQEGFDPTPVVDDAVSRGWRTTATVPLPDGGHVRVLVHPDSSP